ncbi:hypothetical protein TRICI_005065 [Trichomonascus ciferrii]|uniref:Uncharacterized protein n=1 Tax=Trichomonascus ciferrii TaxID=44093 RepID=A0A642V197_9ASCO|nr:hypothetical protein TRICI_005065 [Trichomonascus ciferrii]
MQGFPKLLSPHNTKPIGVPAERPVNEKPDEALYSGNDVTEKRLVEEVLNGGGVPLVETEPVTKDTLETEGPSEHPQSNKSLEELDIELRPYFQKSVEEIDEELRLYFVRQYINAERAQPQEPLRETDYHEVAEHTSRTSREHRAATKRKLDLKDHDQNEKVAMLCGDKGLWELLHTGGVPCPGTQQEV